MISNGYRILLVRALTFSVLLLIVLATGLTGCSGKPASLNADLGAEIILKPGQSARIASETLIIRFVEVVSDSRCPTGVQCIWAGEVSSLIEIDYQDQVKSMVLKQLGSGDAADQYVDYQISFDMQPYPEAGKQIKAEDYRLHLMITKEP